MNIENKIKEILKEPFDEDKVIQITNLLTQQREEAYQKGCEDTALSMGVNLYQKGKEDGVRGFVDYLQPYIDKDNEWYPVTREWFLERVKEYLPQQREKGE
jgi:hypothetical protein